VFPPPARLNALLFAMASKRFGSVTEFAIFVNDKWTLTTIDMAVEMMFNIVQQFLCQCQIGCSKKMT
jgi:hypothetical protein